MRHISVFPRQYSLAIKVAEDVNDTHQNQFGMIGKSAFFALFLQLIIGNRTFAACVAYISNESLGNKKSL